MRSATLPAPRSDAAPSPNVEGRRAGVGLGGTRRRRTRTCPRRRRPAVRRGRICPEGISVSEASTSPTVPRPDRPRRRGRICPKAPPERPDRAYRPLAISATRPTGARPRGGFVKISGLTSYHLPGTRYPWVFLRIDTDEGIHGIGQISSGPNSAVVAAAASKLGPLLVGEDPSRIEYLWTKL